MTIPSDKGWYNDRDVTREVSNIKLFSSQLCSKEKQTVNITLGLGMPMACCMSLAQTSSALRSKGAVEELTLRTGVRY